MLRWLPILSLLIAISFTASAQPSAPQTAPPQPRPEVSALMAKALQARNAYRWDEAIELCRQARQQAVVIGDEAGEAFALNAIGYIHGNTGQPEKALEYYKLALPLWREIGDRSGEAVTLNGIGFVYDNIGQPQNALDYYQQSLPLRRAVGDRVGLATTLGNIGSVYHVIGQPQQALGYYQQALLLNIVVADKAGEATTLSNIGNVYADAGQPEKALTYYQRALPLRRETGDKAGEATTLSNLGLVYANTGQPPKALEAFQEALSLHQAAGDRAGEAVALNNIGGVYDTIGQPEKALDYYQEALPLRRAVEDKIGEAATLSNIGIVYNEIGQPLKARELFQQALPLSRAAGDKKQEAVDLVNIGFVYDSAGQLEKALAYYQQALPLARGAGDRAREAVILNNIGTIYHKTGRLRNALDYFEQAEVTSRKVGDKDAEATTLTNEGGVYTDAGETETAMQCFEKALPLKRETGDRAGEATTLNSIGYLYIKTARIPKALDLFQQALRIRREVGDRAGEAVTLSNLGYVYAQMAEPQKALECYQQAVAIRESFYPQISDPAQVTAYLQQDLGALYACTAVTLLQSGRAGEALAMLERGRNSGLARLAGENRLPLTSLLGSDAPAWMGLNHRLNALTEQAQKVRERLDLAHAVKDAPREETLSQERDGLMEQQGQAEADRDKLFTRLLQDHPDFQRLFYGRTTSYPALRKALLSSDADADTLYLEFGVVDTARTLLFALSRKDGLIPLILNTGQQTLMSQVDRWRDSVLAMAPGEPQRAQELYRTLLFPLEQKGLLRPGRYRSLVIVADGPLLDLPFAALMDRQGKRLVQRFAISTPFSLSLLTWPAPVQDVPENLLAVANPLGPMPALGRTEQQARQMLASFQPAALLTGPQATRAAVLDRMGHCRVLHFGVHGEASSENGLSSCLLLAGAKEEDQELTAAEITEHRLSAQLAVLSACETMQGQKSGGEGLLGLSWAFRAAGCPSVVASLWKVEETATASLMRRFYQELRKGARKDVALQRAMLGVMAEPGHEAPYYWAAFEVMGKTGPLRLAPTGGRR